MRDFWEDVAWIAGAVLFGAIISCTVTLLIGVIA